MRHHGSRKSIPLRSWPFLATVPLLLLLLGGCGYRSVDWQGRDFVAAGKKIAVPLFANKTYRPYLESIVTQAVVRELARQTGGEVVPSDRAELLLTGAVLSSATVPIAYTASDTVREYRAALTIEATLVEKKSGSVLWKGELTASQDYPTNTDLALQQNNETAAFLEIGRKLADDLSRKISEEF
jgi:outer membrane lipopolysaccharide assembly protein LptE/RlpB